MILDLDAAGGRRDVLGCDGGGGNGVGVAACRN